MSSKGYLVLAQDSYEYDYIRLAYALALSIKNSQTTVNKICLATNANIDSLDPKIKEAFDDIVPIPWSDQAHNSLWKIENKWKYYYMSPYDETVILDADMIFPTDISHWWDILSQQDVWITNSPRTFRGELITSTKYRSAFVSNNLPNVYTAFMYFKKSVLAAELFRLIEIIFEHWERFFYIYLDETRPQHLSGDVAYALAIKILGIEHECFGNLANMPTFVHMKGHLQNIDEKFILEDWTTTIPTYFRADGGFKIGNYEQHLPFHYHIKSWLSDHMISVLEDRVLT
jgi:hypothetical protein